ncbi:MAG: CAP domain-containing protein, partial [Inhella sp.]
VYPDQHPHLGLRALTWARLGLAMAAAVLTAACGGGGGGGGTTPVPPPSPTPPPPPSLVVPLTGTLQTSVPAPVYAANSEEQAAFAIYNEIRQKSGAGLFRQEPKLDTAALGHLTWIAKNGINTHTQPVGSAGFTGATVTDRIRAAGFTEAVRSSEGIGGRNILNPKGTCAPLSVPYHAADFFNSWTHVGFSLFDLSTIPGPYTGLTGAYGCVYNMSLTDSAQLGQVPPSGALVTYPFDGGTGIHRAVIGNEIPRPPIALFPNLISGPSVVVGARNADYVNWKADGSLSPTVTQFEVKDDLGNVLPFTILAHSALKSGPGVVLNADARIPEGMAVGVVMSPLTIGKVYRVNYSITLKPGATPITKSWTFTANETGI